MKKIYLSLLIGFLFNFSFSQVSWQGGSNPDATASATILFDKTGTGLAAYSGTIYAHTGVTVNGTPWQNVKGSWGNNTTQPALTLVSGNIYKLDLTPTILAYYGVSSGTITKVNIVLDPKVVAASPPPITLRVEAMNLRNVMDFIMQLTGLNYTLRDEALFISNETLTTNARLSMA